MAMLPVLVLMLSVAAAPQGPAPAPPAASSPSLSQSPPAPLPPPQALRMLPEDSPDYELGPGDVLSISVSGVKQFEQSVRVSNSGRLRVPYVGVMYAAGMTTVQTEREIARLIKEHELVTEPVVRVQVTEYHARPTYVVGMVTTPGQFVITGDMYLLDLISKAGGLTAAAADLGYLYRRFPKQRPATAARVVGAVEAPAGSVTAPTPATEATTVTAMSPSQAAVPVPGTGDAGSEPDVITVNLADLKSGQHPEANLQLQGGDVLYVPRRKFSNVYIIGDVANPGAYELPAKARYSAAQAIILTGGPLKTAKMSKAFLMRYDSNGTRQVHPVNFDAILRGKQKDIPVQADDIIYVPNSAAKTIGIGLLDMIPTFIQQWLIF
jgi:polysaccharide export outer membrane protein